MERAVQPPAAIAPGQPRLVPHKRLPLPKQKHSPDISCRHSSTNYRRFSLREVGTSAKDIAHTAFVTSGSSSCLRRRAGSAFRSTLEPAPCARPGCTAQDHEPTPPALPPV